MSLVQGAKKVAAEVEKTMQGLGAWPMSSCMFHRHDTANMFIYYCSMHGCTFHDTHTHIYTYIYI